MVDHRQPRRRNSKAPGGAAPAVAAPPFGTGLGLGMGAPTTVLDALARRPAEERAAVLGELQRGAGNRSVSRSIMDAGGGALA